MHPSGLPHTPVYMGSTNWLGEATEHPTEEHNHPLQIAIYTHVHLNISSVIYIKPLSSVGTGDSVVNNSGHSPRSRLNYNNNQSYIMQHIWGLAKNEPKKKG